MTCKKEISLRMISIDRYPFTPVTYPGRSVFANYFGEHLTAAHRLIIRTWQERAGRLAPNAKQTDISEIPTTII